MKIIKTITQLATITIAMLFSGVQADNSDHTEASDTIRVTVELQDMIAINNLPASILMDTNNANDGLWWRKTETFSVLRNGPSNIEPQRFTLTVTGSQGTDGEAFNLAHLEGNDRPLPMIIDVQDFNDGDSFTRMVDGVPREFESNLSMSQPDTEETNMTLRLSVLQSDILERRGGDYGAQFTFTVAAK